MNQSVCIVTTGQPSSNPRAVKEADALTAAGYQVHMVGAHWAAWADGTDPGLLAERKWTVELVKWRAGEAPFRYWHTRLRHHAARTLIDLPVIDQLVLPAALSRVTPELARRARRRRADLFVAHNLGALPAAAAAAERWGARLGFDAEDFHSGQFAPADRSAARRATVASERRWIPRCDYVTAASPGIAASYAPLCARPPVLVRNVFPLADRPAAQPVGSRDSVLRLYWFSQTIGPDRGLEHVVRAMGQLPDGRLELHLRGVWQGGYEAGLRSVAREAGLAPHRIVCHPPGAPAEMARLAAHWDVGLVLETGDTNNSDLLQSNKVMTYLLAGVPFLSTDTSGHRELLDRAPGAGWLVPPGDVESLAARLAGLAANRDDVRRAAAEAWHWGGIRFNWDTEQHIVLREVERVLGWRSSSAA